MSNTNTDVNIIGDKLQSLCSEDNFLTKILDEGLPNVDLDIKEKINLNKENIMPTVGKKKFGYGKKGKEAAKREAKRTGKAMKMTKEKKKVGPKARSKMKSSRY